MRKKTQLVNCYFVVTKLESLYTWGWGQGQLFLAREEVGGGKGAYFNSNMVSFPKCSSQLTETSQEPDSTLGTIILLSCTLMS